MHDGRHVMKSSSKAMQDNKLHSSFYVLVHYTNTIVKMQERLIMSLLGCLLLAHVAAGTQIPLLQEAEKMEHWIITVRRKLHQYPELMYQVSWHPRSGPYANIE